MDCVESLVNSDDDGELIATFLLTEYVKNILINFFF